MTEKRSERHRHHTGNVLICLMAAWLLSFCVPLATWAQTEKKVSIEVENALVRTVFHELQKKTQMYFVYEESTISNTQRVSLSFQNAPLSTVLDELCRQASLKYEIKRDLILINPAKKNVSQAAPSGSGACRLRGNVSDQDGEPLLGVNIWASESKQGTITDTDGNYTLKAMPGELIVFTYVGMEPHSVKAPARGKALNVRMVPDEISLDEFVVTGYQTLSKERATGSFNTISKEQLEKPSSNIASRLIGMASGVQATTDIYGNPTFEIRGLSTLYATEQPLVVVDGFAVEGDFSSINPNDVESITVLKDAAAASIWGARSANGVIVITTKNGINKNQKDGVSVEVSSFMKIAPKADVDYLMSTATSAEVIDYEQKVFNRYWGAWPMEDGGSDPYYFSASLSPGLVAMTENYLGYLSDDELNNLLDKYRTLNNHGQIKKYMLQNPVTFQTNGIISTKNERATNTLSLMYEDNDYYWKGDKSYRMMANYRTNVKLCKWLDFNFSGMYSYSKSYNNSESLPYGFAPYEMLVDEDGTRNAIGNTFYLPNLERYIPAGMFPCDDWTYNPITERESHNKSSIAMNARFQAGLRLNILEGLSIESKFQYELVNSEWKNQYYANSFYVRSMMNTTSSWDKTTNEVTPNMPEGDILQQGRSRVDAWNFRNQLNFNRTFGKHAFAVVAGTELQNRVAKTYGYPDTYGYNDETLSVGTLPNGPGSDSNNALRVDGWDDFKVVFDYTNSFGYTTDRYFSLYGNLSYTYDEKYTLSASARTDASNLISDDPDYRYSPFWSVGLGWQMGKERFMQGIDWIDRLTVRLTYGYNGNVDKTTSFKPLITMYTTPYPYTNEPYATIATYGNPTLRWEKTGTWNLGIDYSVLGGKLYGKVELYNKNTRDMIARVTIPSFNGTTSQKLNNAEMNNKGFELEIGSTLPITNRISWSGGFNLSYNKNRITKLYKASYSGLDLVSGGQLAYMEGEDANTLWCYKYAGVYNDGTEESPNWQPKIVDKEGNLYDFSAYPSVDGRLVSYKMGTKVAPWTLGFNSSFHIYDFDFSFILTGKYGHKYMRQAFNYPVSGNYGRMTPNKQYSEIINCDPMKRIPLPQNEVEDNYSNWTSIADNVSYLVENAGVLRMQEISLTYNLPHAFLRKIGFQSCQLYAMVNNAFSIYASSFDEDPEYPRESIKPQPAYTFGLKFQF